MRLQQGRTVQLIAVNVVNRGGLCTIVSLTHMSTRHWKFVLMHRTLYQVKCYFIVFSLHCKVLLVIAPLPHLEKNGNKKKCIIMICISFKVSESKLIL